MKNFSVRYTLIIILLAIFSVIIFITDYKNRSIKISLDLTKLPLKVEGWSVEEMPIDDKTKSSLETDSILMRKYLKGDKVVWLAIVYYQNTQVALHLPESCYIGQGSYIVNTETEELKGADSLPFHANKLVLTGNKGNQLILYYFQTSGIITDNYLVLRWHMILNKIKTGTTKAALVRFSSLIVEKNEKMTIEFLKEFIKEISPQITRELF
ncbi:MAG: hypothetical protein AMJ95_13875 [Omnitrophica WOR_2 bacterium SM23_72]|nr:MAG: hypothetical protein AMJ95_13875 [Omnitrophica WOR_2 bacterium SM23_72]